MRKQRGLSTFSILCWVMMLLLSNIVLKLIPVYFDHYIAVSAVRTGIKEAGGQNLDDRQVLALIAKSMAMNTVHVVKAEDLKLTDQNDKVKVQMKYDVVKKLFYNVSLMVSFDDEFISE